MTQHGQHNGFGEGARHEAGRRASRLGLLSARQREVLALLAAGDSLPEIAKKIHRSIDTVKSHRRAIGVKLGLDDRVQLARAAIEMGLSPLEAAAVELRSVEGAVALVDKAGRIMSCSPTFARMLRSEARALQGADIRSGLGLCPELEGVLLGLAGGQARTVRCAAGGGTVEATFLPLPALGQTYVVLSAGCSV